MPVSCPSVVSSTYPPLPKLALENRSLKRGRQFAGSACCHCGSELVGGGRCGSALTIASLFEKVPFTRPSMTHLPSGRTVEVTLPLQPLASCTAVAPAAETVRAMYQGRTNTQPTVLNLFAWRLRAEETKRSLCTWHTPFFNAQPCNQQNKPEIIARSSAGSVSFILASVMPLTIPHAELFLMRWRRK